MEAEQSLQKTAGDALEYIQALEVKDQESLNLANKAMVRIGVIRKGIIGYFKPLKTTAKTAHQAVVDKEKEALQPVNEAETILKPKIRTYVLEQQRIRAEAVRKRLAEIERKELEQEKALKKAAALEDAGKIKEAQKEFKEAEKMEEKEVAPVTTQAPVMSGTHTVTYTRWRVIDPQLIPRQYLVYDKARIDAEVKRHKMATGIPGIEVYEETEVRRSRS